MAVKQEELQPQSPLSAQPEEGQGPTSGAQQGSGSQAELPAPTTQEPAGRAADEPASTAEMNLSQFLEQEIAAAIQPVLHDFRKQVTQAMAEQTEAAPAIDAGEPGAPGEAHQGQGIQQPVQQTAQSPAPQAGERQPLVQAAQQVQAQLPPQEQLVESAERTRAQLERREPQGAQPPPTGAVRSALQTIERLGEQWLQWLLTAGLTAGLSALLTDSTHAAIQRRADDGLHAIVEKMFEALPDGANNRGIRDKTERTLQAILHEALDAVFGVATRAALQQGGTEAIRGALHGDSGGALSSVEPTLRAMAEALMAVLRRHQQTIFRLGIAIALLAVASSLGQSDHKKS